jgi:hypothetical protein
MSWKKKSGTLTMPLLAFLLMILLTRAELFEFYDAGLVPDSPGNDLPGVFAVVGLDDRPAAVMAIVAAPFKIMEIARSVDFLDDGITVPSLVRGFDKITVHGSPLWKDG